MSSMVTFATVRTPNKSCLSSYFRFGVTVRCASHGMGTSFQSRPLLWIFLRTSSGVLDSGSLLLNNLWTSCVET